MKTLKYTEILNISLKCEDFADYEVLRCVPAQEVKPVMFKSILTIDFH